MAFQSQVSWDLLSAVGALGSMIMQMPNSPVRAEIIY